MSGGDMYGEPSYDDVQRDVQEATGQTSQSTGLSKAACVLVILMGLGLVVVLGLLVKIVQMLW